MAYLGHLKADLGKQGTISIVKPSPTLSISYFSLSGRFWDLLPSSKVRVRKVARVTLRSDQQGVIIFNFGEGQFLTKRNSNVKWREGGLGVFYGT